MVLNGSAAYQTDGLRSENLELAAAEDRGPQFALRAGMEAPASDTTNASEVVGAALWTVQLNGFPSLPPPWSLLSRLANHCAEPDGGSQSPVRRGETHRIQLVKVWHRCGVIEQTLHGKRKRVM